MAKIAICLLKVSTLTASWESGVVECGHGVGAGGGGWVKGVGVRGYLERPPQLS